MTATVVLSMDKLAYPQTGLGQFSLHLARALTTRPDDSTAHTLLVPKPARALLEGLDATFETLSPLDKERVLRWTRSLGPLTPAQRCRPAVWHALAQDAKYLPFDRGTPVLLTIHDLNYLREKEERELPRRLGVTQARVSRCEVIVAVSQFTAEEVRRHLDVGDRPVHVIHNGRPETGSIEPIKPLAAPARPFLFAIGEVVPRKNVHVLLPMMELLPELGLIVAGRHNTAYAAEFGRTIDARSLSRRVRMIGTVSDAERLWLYRHAEGVVIPSLTEGFGLPVIEGMAEGRPVFMSNVTSLPEIGGELGYYWDSYEPEHMAAVVREGLTSWDADASLAVREHAAQFTWRRAAEQYSELYRSMIR